MSVHRGHELKKSLKFYTQKKTCTESCTVQNQHSNTFPCMNNLHSRKENKKTILFMFLKL